MFHKNISYKKTIGTCEIPPKLVNLSSAVLSQLLVDDINNSISEGVFPDKAEVASVSPVLDQSLF